MRRVLWRVLWRAPWRVVGLAAAALTLPVPALAAEAPPQAAQCVSCHGIDGRSPIDYVPIIHGQQPAYLRQALMDYRDGRRSHGRAPVMTRFLSGLSDSEIDALADWFGEARGPDVGAATAELATIPPTAAATDTVGAPPAAADRLVYIDEDAGWRRLLDASHQRDYFRLDTYVESEKFLTFCAPASMAAVLNSLEIDRPVDPARYPYPFFTQESVFTLANQKIRSFEEVVTEGLTLAEVGQFLTNLQVRAQVHFAEETSADEMRRVILEALSDRGRRVILNYERAAMGQRGGGHVSPIGAYDAASDSVLVMDVAPYKYPAVWVPFATLYRAMEGIDSGSERSRGVVLVGALE